MQARNDGSIRMDRRAIERGEIADENSGERDEEEEENGGEGE